MSKCIVCKKVYKKTNGSFFFVPTHEKTRKIWSEICRMEFPLKARVCEDHFFSSDIK